MVFTEYTKQGFFFLISFGKAMQYPSLQASKNMLGAQCIFEIPLGKVL
jgi:hypothetical protein